MSGTQNFDFERTIDRRGGDSEKWNKYAGRDVLPMWVADMDFAAPPVVLEALQRRIAQGCLGYAQPWPALVESALTYFQRRYDWRVEPEWLVWLPGLVTGINAACRAVDGGVITATPVYPPFLTAPDFAGKELVAVPLRLEGGCWSWDFDRMAATITPQTRLMLLCHPHNPVGRAWHESELRQLADFCCRHNLIVCSDEIHCDLILDADRNHVPLARLDEEMARRSITLMAPSKTFNIPGLGCSVAIISDTGLRQSLKNVIRGIVPQINVLGLVAGEAAFRGADTWRDALLCVLRRNRDRVQEAIAKIPQLAMTPVEATYLAWIDARDLNIADPAQFFEDAGVGLSDGVPFGAPGWVRLNFGCAPAILNQALERMARACSTLARRKNARIRCR